jgi:hypothetical protein
MTLDQCHGITWTELSHVSLADHAEDNESAATAMDTKLGRCLSEGSATGGVQSPSCLGIRTVAKFANRVATRSADRTRRVALLSSRREIRGLPSHRARPHTPAGVVWPGVWLRRTARSPTRRRRRDRFRAALGLNDAHER